MIVRRSTPLSRRPMAIPLISITRGMVVDKGSLTRRKNPFCRNCSTTIDLLKGAATRRSRWPQFSALFKLHCNYPASYPIKESFSRDFFDFTMELHPYRTPLLLRDWMC